MNRVLVDTDIVIDFLRTNKGLLPDLLNLQKKNETDLYMSTITILEIFAGKKSKKQADFLHELITSFKVVYLTPELAQFAGELKRDHNLPTAFADLVIGSSTLYVKAELATRNRKHFQGIPKLKFYKT